MESLQGGDVERAHAIIVVFEQMSAYYTGFQKAVDIAKRFMKQYEAHMEDNAKNKKERQKLLDMLKAEQKANEERNAQHQQILEQLKEAQEQAGSFKEMMEIQDQRTRETIEAIQKNTEQQMNFMKQ